MAGLMCAGALLLGVALAGARSSASSENSVVSAPPSAIKITSDIPQKNTRLRENEEFSGTGQFRMIGDRVVFLSDDNQRRFIGLENLILERVAKTIADNPAQMQWIVLGNVTEYQGSNYLLFTRAQLKSQIHPTDSKP